MSNIIDIATEFLGTDEIKGLEHNPKIVKMFKKSGNAWVKDDETPWCAAFVGAVLADAGIKGTMKLNARSYLDWGVSVDEPVRGDVVVLWRGLRDGWKGHVGFYVRHNSMGDIVILGGNQGDTVSIKEYPAERLLGYRRPVAKKRAVEAPALGMLAVLAATIALFWDKVEAAFVGMLNGFI